MILTFAADGTAGPARVALLVGRWRRVALLVRRGWHCWFATANRPVADQQCHPTLPKKEPRGRKIPTRGSSFTLVQVHQMVGKN